MIVLFVHIELFLFFLALQASSPENFPVANHMPTVDLLFYLHWKLKPFTAIFLDHSFGLPHQIHLGCSRAATVHQGYRNRVERSVLNLVSTKFLRTVYHFLSSKVRGQSSCFKVSHYCIVLPCNEYIPWGRWWQRP